MQDCNTSELNDECSTIGAEARRRRRGELTGSHDKNADFRESESEERAARPRDYSVALCVDGFSEFPRFETHVQRIYIFARRKLYLNFS